MPLPTDTAIPVAEHLLRDLRSGDEQRRFAAARRMESDPTLRQGVERLLAATMATGAADVAAQPDRPLRIGAYRLLEELGSGGMGAVFLAERDIDGAAQRVALKLLHGLPTSEGRRRFARERALLAGLNHPNIAALLDGGETDQGQPYLVMEYVDGVPISDWVRSTQPSLTARLRVLARVCAAVAHAHQRLVLHRDIKPGNILVRPDGEPVLLDFGIAKVLDDTTGLAETATLAFTPAYAAPEQITGRGITTATDVYGLGAVLFEALSEQSLVELRLEAGVAALPSRHCGVSVQARALRGDLDRMVAKAMHPDPERRYVTPAALAEDIERYLAGLPVLATPDRFSYRLIKLIGRHRAATLMLAVAMVLSLGFVWRLQVERNRALDAERRAHQEAVSAQRARDFLVSVFASAAPRETLGQPITPRELLDKARAKVEQGLMGDQDAAMATWLALADTYIALGVPGEAAKAAEQALALSRADTPARQQQQISVQETLAAAYNNLGRHDAAQPLEAVVLQWREAQADADPRALASSYAELAYAAQQRGEYLASERLFHQAKAKLTQVGGGSADDQAYLLAGLATSLAALGRLEAAELAIADAERNAVSLDARAPTQVFVLRGRSRVDELAGRFASSVAALEQAAALASAVVGVDAAVVAAIENDLGVALNGAGRFREALEHLLRARAGMARVDAVAATELAFVDANISALYESLGDYPQSIDYARRALAVYEQMPVGAAPMQRQARVNLARALSFSGQHVQAMEQMERALAEGRSTDGEQSLSYQLDRFRYAGILRRAGKTDLAAQTLTQSSAALLEQLGAEHPIRQHVLRLQGLIAADRGDRDGAISGLRQAIEFAESSADSDAVASAQTRVDLAKLLVDSDPQRASDQLALALPVLTQALLPVAPALQEAQQLQRQLQLAR